MLYAQYVYVTNYSDNTISAYSVGRLGALGRKGFSVKASISSRGLRDYCSITAYKADNACTISLQLTTVACLGNTFSISTLWTSGSRSAQPSSTTMS